MCIFTHRTYLAINYNTLSFTFVERQRSSVVISLPYIIEGAFLHVGNL